MKLLIVTQVMDYEHPILGFFHRWVEEFAKYCESVQVICLQEGKHNLPSNVKVYSLGKEKSKSKFYYLINFYRLIWNLRHEYDNVFVHMNQIYVILGVPLWHVYGKKVGLWYMHGTVSPSLRLAEKMTNFIFTGSAESFRLKSTRSFVTGHGIDTERFYPQILPKDIELITVGRITSSKNLKVLIDLVVEIKNIKTISLTIVGAGISSVEKKYEQYLKQYVSERNLNEVIIFQGNIQQSMLPTILNRSKLFVTVAKNGSLDKAILEAMACGLPVVSMASGSISLPLGEFQVNTNELFIEKVVDVIESGIFTRQENTDYVLNNHSIKSLIPKILKTFK